MAISFVAAVCPSCGASIQVDESKQSCFCQSCGNQILIQDAIQRIQGTVKIDRSDEVSNLVIRARRAIQKGTFDEAEDHCNHALDIDANCKEAADLLERLSHRVVRRNLHVRRNKPRTAMEKKNSIGCKLILDGIKYALDSDDQLDLMIPIGTHEINICRAALKLKQPISVTVNTKYDDFTVVYEEAFFSIKAQCQYQRISGKDEMLIYRR